MKLLKVNLVLPLVLVFALVFVNGDPEPDALADPEPAFDLLEMMVRRGKDMLKAIPQTGIRIGSQVLNIVPTPEAVFQLSKEILIGLPQEIVAYAINKVCSTAVSINAVKPSYTPSADEMNFDFITPDYQKISVSIDNPDVLWNDPKFNKNWNVTLVITGWNSNINRTNFALDVLYQAYRRREVNFVIFDTAKFVDSLYTWSAFNTEGVGESIGKAIAALVKYVDVNKIHLIGHSLGAHMCGYAGRTFTRLTDQQLPRITGLDPAQPCFNEGQRLNGLQRGDAAFVDIIHSNPGILGIKDPIGDVDFYPNGRYSMQPGCWTILCAHSRSFEYYAETAVPGNEKTFMAIRCSSFADFKKGKCRGKPIPMGIDCPPTVKGDYFLQTNKFPPFGTQQGLQFTRSANAEIGL